MLDPLTSLGLAANVVQFIDVLAKLIDRSRQIHLGGTTHEQQEARHIAQDAVLLSNKVANAAAASSQIQYNPNLLDLSNASLKTAQDLIETLDQIAADPFKDVKNDVWKKLLDPLGNWRMGISMYKALKTIMGKERIEQLRQELRDFQNQLELHILVDLRELTSLEKVVNDQRFNALDANVQCILKTILTQNADVFNQIEGHFGSMHMRHARSDALIRQYGDNILNAIAHCSQALPRSRSSRPDTLPLCLEEGSARQLETRILTHLAYRGMDDRHFLVAESHAQTFRWALRDDSHPQVRWSNLVQWLRDGSGFYWVNGKAASGKSTFMKFIAGQQETISALEQWTQKDGKNKLLMEQFYFWHLGSTYHKSQEALVRSLLRSLLKNYPHLIPQVLRGYWNELLESTKNEKAPSPEPLSSTEIKIAFVKAISQLPPQARVCFFIDGLDEYSGDHLEICKLLESIVGPQVKLVVSSRPLRVFSVFFADCPNLRLQYLTSDDIKNYVSSELSNNKRMRLLSIAQPDESALLTDEIVSRSAGVFLWVILVVKALVRELNDFGNMDDLMSRLEEYPEELDDLYRHMMDQMDRLHRYQASSYLQIVWQASRIQDRWPLTLEQMYFAAAKDPMKILQQPSGTLGALLLAANAEEIEARLVSRCCGLVEAVSVTEAPRHMASQLRASLPVIAEGSTAQLHTLNSMLNFQVVFLHKSVADFLERDEAWQYMVGLTATPNLGSANSFDANVALMNSCLWMIKTYPMTTPPPANFQTNAWYNTSLAEKKWYRHRTMIQHVQQYAELAHISTGQSYGVFKEQAYDTIEGYLLSAGEHLTRRDPRIDWSSHDIGLIFDRRTRPTLDSRAIEKLTSWPA